MASWATDEVPDRFHSYSHQVCGGGSGVSPQDSNRRAEAESRTRDWPAATRMIRNIKLVALMLILGVGPPGYLEAGEIGRDPSYGYVRIGVTPVFLDSQTAFLEDWRVYLEKRMSRKVRFVQRSNYREIMELLLSGMLEFAWICGYPFVLNRDDVELVSVPLYKGKPLYQSYLIVPDADHHTRTILDLEGKLFAYSDPDSNSGFLVPQSQLRLHGVDPDTFFKKSFFTWAHQKVVEAVAAGVVDAGAVDGYVWDTLRIVKPELTHRTRVVEKSIEYGFPPIVATKHIDDRLFESFQRVLKAMQDDEEGVKLLDRLNLDGFSIQSPSLFDAIERLAEQVPRD